MPRLPGVYAVVRPETAPPEFLLRSVGGHFKGRDPTVDLGVLEANWVSGATVVYIGKAGELRIRLRTYAKYGQGQPVGHQGGRYIWQLADHGDLLACWMPTEESPRDTERKLIEDFKARHGRRPFANLVD
ncbi:MAG: hypothetical protein WD004_00260 [Actinomycetota bacterium]